MSTAGNIVIEKPAEILSEEEAYYVGPMT